MAKFRYVNLNPNGEHRNDCVTRAISLASGLDYSEVRRKLRYTSRLLDCIRLCWSCYSFFITEVLGCRQVNCDGLTVGEFADLHPQGIYLIRIKGHLTVIKDNVCYDLWNCLGRECDLAWQIK